MYEWPTYSHLLWMLAGAIPLCIILVRGIRKGRWAIANLSFLFVFSLWIGYHLTPWLALRTGGWDSVLLNPDYVTDGLIFSTLAMILFLIGYKGSNNIKQYEYSDGNFTQRDPPLNSPKAVLILSVMLISFSLFIISIGGPRELWQATYGRGEGQFEEHTFWRNVTNVVIIANMFMSVALSIVSSLALFTNNTKNKIFTCALGLLGLVTATLPFAHAFSRASGYALVLAAIIAIRQRGRKASLIVVFLIVAAGWLSWTGYAQRGNFDPGIGNYLKALASPQGLASKELKDENLWELAFNPMNALDPFTARAWTRSFGESSNAIEGLFDLFAALQPVPSHLVPFEVTAGENLSIVFGTWGSTGLTTPALGELYYWFGLWGALLLLPFGRLCRWIDRRCRASGSISDIILWAATAFGFVIGLHSGVRAQTRPIIYGFVILGISRIYRVSRKAKPGNIVPTIDIPIT